MASRAIAIYASSTPIGPQLAACIDAWSAVSDTLADLGWLLFASCILAILMADLGNGHPERRAATSG
jgi:4-hydroxybenzoate polyprenyltransferase